MFTYIYIYIYIICVQVLRTQESACTYAYSYTQHVTTPKFSPMRAAALSHTYTHTWNLMTTTPSS